MTAAATVPEPQALRALVIDDEKNIRATLVVCLEGAGCAVTAVGTSAAALQALQARSADIAFLDLKLGTESGLALIPQLLALSPGLAIIVVTAHATFGSAVEAMRRGATDYLPKPFTPAQIRHAVDQVRARLELRWRVHDLEGRLIEVQPEIELRTRAPRMQAVLDVIERAASSDAPMLLQGESGTGKSLLARALHARSRRAMRPFVVVNCPTLTDELLASELFGHAKGAFTGALRDQPGRVESAEGGTLFLDEIGEISPGLQAKLLRFLQDKQFERVGESRTRSSDVRVVAATNRNLAADVASGRFREDLLYRINVLELEVPPLRERPDDVIALAEHFLAFFARAAGRAPLELTEAARQVLRAHAWPGNVRELRNSIERVTILWPATRVEPAAFPERMSERMSQPGTATWASSAGSGPQIGGDCTLEALEAAHLRGVLARVTSQEDAARILGVDTSTLWRKRKKLGEA